MTVYAIYRWANDPYDPCGPCMMGLYLREDAAESERKRLEEETGTYENGEPFDVYGIIEEEVIE